MVWEVGKGERVSYLAGTVHFSRYSYRKPLTSLISRTHVTLFEGPLDEASQARIARYGMEGPGEASLVRALDARTAKTINRYFAQSLTFSRTSVDSILGSHGAAPFLDQYVDARPWMTFFQVWSAYLKTQGWNYSEDMEALGIANKLGRRVEFLESIEEQLDALDAVPFERFVRFMGEFDHWGRYTRRFVRHLRRGTLDALLPTTSHFPTRCDAIISRRDPVFFERAKPFFEAGPTVAFLGISHPPGVIARLRDDGFAVRQVVV